MLVVEDNVDDIMILRRHFSRLDGNFRVEICYTAAESIVRVGEQRYDIAFVDRHLPDARGEALIKEISAVAPGLPVVMLTGRGDERLAVEVMKAGAYDYLRKDDLSRSILSRTLRNVLDRARLQARIEAANEELAQLAIRDSLTGLFNRRHFGRLLETEFARARRYGQPLACLMLDIDRFKRFNDTQGHQCGDAVLRHVAELLRGVARQVDVVARYGGEEFILLLPNTDLEGALRVAERTREVICDRPVRFEGTDLHVTTSIGVATNAEPGVDTTEALIKRADDGLYVAKRSGRNRVARAMRVDQPVTPDAIVRRRTSTMLLAILIDRFEANTHARPGHSQRVAEEAARFAARLGCDGEAYDALVLAARIGGLARLTAPTDAAPHQLALSSEALLSDAGLTEATLHTIRFQHERWDGAGQPEQLAGEAIPENARILAVVDRWCQLTADGVATAAALDALRQDAGAAFDPALVEVFTDLQMSDTRAR